ncbi:hypothetical protein GCM10027176_10040 [Actinoallomurus bryophytorum]|uniref:Uncharacterized protein n=1 Tax=Actinoallomurus bryophytorum TaxID=1490222 RepID=A0A543BZH4_9ACTN|nr:hypothetical protein [Actinoallomurus bryophytorum]TQL90232.1 hypothetical protein FB559_7525 [Actinoallomurus bryophytorum]
MAFTEDGTLTDESIGVTPMQDGTRPPDIVFAGEPAVATRVVCLETWGRHSEACG